MIADYEKTMKHWPIYTTANEKVYTLKHVRLLEYAMSQCISFRTAVQAGGSIGYWPRRMARDFQRVITFEPEPLIYDCLAKNLASYDNVEVRPEALGEGPGACGIERRSFGSHFIVPGNTVKMIALDDLQITDLDLLQLDIEGYEIHALNGAEYTIDRCQPIIQVEILDKDAGQDIEAFFGKMQYRKLQTLGRDHVYGPK